MKKISLAGAMFIAAAIPVSAMASPCGTELCLSDFDAASNLSECKPEMDEFFEIVKYRKDKFSPSRTLKARRDYLYKCESGNDTDKERILAKYGAILKPSY